MLGTPLGHADFVSHQLQTVLIGGAAHSLEPNPQGGRAERVADSVALCVGTCQLPHPCFAPSSNVSVRSHQAGLWQCRQFHLADGPGAICVVGRSGSPQCPKDTYPSVLGELGRLLAMIRQRHPDVAVQLVHQLEGHPDTPCLQAAADAARSLQLVVLCHHRQRHSRTGQGQAPTAGRV